MQKYASAIALSAVALMAAGVAVAAPAWSENAAQRAQNSQPAAPRATTDDFWAHARFEHDDDDGRRYGVLPRPNRAALSRVGVVRVLDVEWDDGRVEVEGLDARGREVDVVMDRTGQRVIRHHVERRDD